jgi:hypothetical protein
MRTLTSFTSTGQTQKAASEESFGRYSGTHRRSNQIDLYNPEPVCESADMVKKLLPLLLAPLFLAGCNATFTNLTPQHQVRNANNAYPVEVALDTRQQTLRWDTIKPQIMVGTEFYPMRPTLLMTNRWEGLVPVPSGTNIVHYRYKFDYNYTGMGIPRADSALSPEYTLRILDK